MNKKEDRTHIPKRTLLETSNNTVENSQEYSKIVNERNIWKNLIRNSFEEIKKKKNKKERFSFNFEVCGPSLVQQEIHITRGTLYGIVYTCGKYKR